MKYLPDTNVWVQFLRNDKAVRSWFDQLGVDDLALSAVVLEELVVGGLRSGSAEALRAVVELPTLYRVLPFDQECAIASAHLQALLISQGLKIGSRDAQIAGTALFHGLTLVTHDQAFGRVKGLLTVDWQLAEP